MSQVQHVVGDLLASDEKFIAQGCNTHGVMGAGIALHIANKYPEVERVYAAYCRTRDFTVGSCLPVTDRDSGVTVFNLGTQRNPGKDGSYWAIMLSFGNLFEYCVRYGIERVAIPRIGCGIAGLDWSCVEFIIDGIYQWVPNGPEIVVYTHPKDQGKF